MKPFQLLEVTWVDSDHGSGWELTRELHTSKTMLCKSVGYFLREVGDNLQLVQSTTNLSAHDEQVNGILTIPKVAIKRKRIIK